MGKKKASTGPELEWAAPAFSRTLVTIGNGKKPLTVEVPPGAIVRIRPEQDWPEGEEEQLRAAFEKAGAARVFVIPRPRADVVPAREAPAKAWIEGPRAAVLALVSESNATDREGLRALCEKVMEEEGL